MDIKELDCVELKDKTTGTILEVHASNEYFLFQFSEHQERCNEIIEIKKEQIEKITFRL